MKILLFSIIAASFASASLAEMCADEIQSLAWVRGANPVLDAQKAIQEGNLKFRAVYGFTVIVPGVNTKHRNKALEPQDYMPIEGTSDALCEGEHSDLNIIATEYAKKYNQVILKVRANAS